MSYLIDSVLLVDDDMATNHLHKVIIRKSGLIRSVSVVTDGREALLHLQKIGQRGPDGNIIRAPDLIFLDINMPGMNGLEFLAALETLPTNLQKQSVVIMLTTSLLDSDQQRAESFECVYDFVNKPLTVERLRELLHKHVEAIA